MVLTTGSWTATVPRARLRRRFAMWTSRKSAIAPTRPMKSWPSATVETGCSGGRPMNRMCGPWTGSTVHSCSPLPSLAASASRASMSTDRVRRSASLRASGSIDTARARKPAIAPRRASVPSGDSSSSSASKRRSPMTVASYGWLARYACQWSAARSASAPAADPGAVSVRVSLIVAAVPLGSIGDAPADRAGRGVEGLDLGRGRSPGYVGITGRGRAGRSPRPRDRRPADRRRRGCRRHGSAPAGSPRGRP